MKAQATYTDDEIIRRVIEAASPVSGPSGYPLTIKYVADNSTEPPVIYIDLCEGVELSVFDFYVDQNTNLSEFNNAMDILSRRAELCARAVVNKTDYETERDKERKRNQPTDEELPF